MSAINSAQALSLLKIRLNRLEGDTSLDQVLSHRIDAAMDTLQSRYGIKLTDSPRHLELVSDLAAFMYQSRDQTGAMPPWLRLRIREEWLMKGESADDS